jgi:hypothetical protein
MKETVKFCLAIMTAILTQSCGVSQLAKQQIKRLDSLSGSVNALRQSMNKIDSLELSKTVTLYRNYASFIQSKVNDTLSKEEALQIKAFFDSGTALENYAANRPLMENRLTLLSKQLSDLSKDIQAQALSDLSADRFFQNEWQQVNNLLPQVLAQEKLFYLNTQKLTQSMPAVMEIIRKHNKQQLPIVILTKNS